MGQDRQILPAKTILNICYKDDSLVMPIFEVYITFLAAIKPQNKNNDSLDMLLAPQLL